LCREVADSICWSRFSRIPLGTTVPHPSTLGKITTRCGPEAIEQLNKALLVRAAGQKVVRLDKVGNRGGPSSRSGELPYTERANRSLERASRLALRRLDPQVDPSHILLSVLDVEGRAGQVLRGLSVDPATVRRHLEAVNVGGSAPQEADSPGPAGGSREVRGPDPACASCGASLSAHLAHRGLDASGADGTTARFVVAYCSSCGAAVGASPT